MSNYEISEFKVNSKMSEYKINMPDIQCIYYVCMGDGGKWFVIRYEDAYRNGGQDCREYEHAYGFSNKASACKWVLKDAKQIASWDSTLDEKVEI
jgi:hypothetical protein